MNRMMAVHEPLSRPALVPHERRLIIAARADGICTPQHAVRLWEHWERPRLHWYPGGHLVQLGRRAALGEILRLLEEEDLLQPVVRPRAVPRPTPRSAPVLAPALGVVRSAAR